MLQRRSFLTGIAALAFAPGPGPARALKPSTVSLAALGAIADGRTDATAALRRGFASGAVVDGEGGTFAVGGSLRAGPAFRGLVNATLIQTSPRSRGGRFFEIEQARDFAITDVALRRSDDGEEPGGRESILDLGGVFVVRCRDFTLRGLRVSGGGVGSAVAVMDCERFDADGLEVSDLAYLLPRHPSDDAIHGIVFVRATSFKLRNARVTRIGGSDGRTERRDFNRAVAATGCSSFEISGLHVRDAGQGLDLTGSIGNRDFRVRDSVAEDCASWGFKFANSAFDGTVERCRSLRTGYGGFVASGPSEVGIPATQRIVFDRCSVEEVIGGAGRSSFGFGVMSVPAIDPGYPRGIVFRSCTARTRAAGHLMTFGFRNDVSAEAAGEMPNRAIDCRAVGFTDGAFRGL